MNLSQDLHLKYANSQLVSTKQNIINLLQVKEYIKAASQLSLHIESTLILGQINWINGNSPIDLFNNMLRVYCESLAILQQDESSFRVTSQLVSSELVGYIAALVNEPWSPTFQDNNLGIQSLDCIISEGLHDSFRQDRWLEALEILPKNFSGLARKSFLGYHDLLCGQNIFICIENCLHCFKLRKKDRFFREGVVSIGGDSNINVDFRLSAILKRKRVLSNTIHDWIW